MYSVRCIQVSDTSTIKHVSGLQLQSPLVPYIMWPKHLIPIRISFPSTCMLAAQHVGTDLATNKLHYLVESALHPTYRTQTDHIEYPCLPFHPSVVKDGCCNWSSFVSLCLTLSKAAGTPAVLTQKRDGVEYLHGNGSRQFTIYFYNPDSVRVHYVIIGSTATSQRHNYQCTSTTPDPTYLSWPKKTAYTYFQPFLPAVDQHLLHQAEPKCWLALRQ